MIPALTLLFSWVNPSLAWFIFGFVLFLLELAAPGFFVFFFGLGAWLVSLLLPFVELEHTAQLSIFIVSSVVFLTLFRSRLHNLMNSKTDAASAQVEEEFVGKRASVITSIDSLHPGRVVINGVEWSARSDAPIAEGAVVEVVARESLTLVVRAVA